MSNATAQVPQSKLAQLHPRRFFLETWQRMDDEAEADRQDRRAKGLGYDFGPVVALAMGAVFLTAMEYWGGSKTFGALLDYLHAQAQPDNPLGDSFYSEIQSSPFYRLIQFGWWSGWRVLGYFILPVLCIWAMKDRVRDNGLETKGLMEHAWIYGLGYAVVFVCVVIVSFTDEFSTYYPFYKLASRSWGEFLIWELMYAAQFFSLEFFFRGWWMKQLKPMMGSHAIFAMVVPYCMIHYGKPGVEALGAILAGIFLGTLSMKTRSIWSGFLIHVSVAVSMDTAALLQTSGLPKIWWPEF